MRRKGVIAYILTQKMTWSDIQYWMCCFGSMTANRKSDGEMVGFATCCEEYLISILQQQNWLF
jgi:hypothetical protein